MELSLKEERPEVFPQYACARLCNTCLSCNAHPTMVMLARVYRIKHFTKPFSAVCKVNTNLTSSYHYWYLRLYSSICATQSKFVLHILTFKQFFFITFWKAFRYRTFVKRRRHTLKLCLLVKRVLVCCIYGKIKFTVIVQQRLNSMASPYKRVSISGCTLKYLFYE